MNDRPNPTRFLEMLDPTSKTWLEHDESYQPIVGEKPPVHAPWPLQCERTPEYRALSDAACHEKQCLSRLGMVLKELIYHQDGLRSAGLEDSLISREPEHQALFRAAANSLHTFIAKAKFEQDAHKQKQAEAEQKMHALRQAERDEKRAAHPEDYMVPTIERLEAEGKPA